MRKTCLLPDTEMLGAEATGQCAKQGRQPVWEGRAQLTGHLGMRQGPRGGGRGAGGSLKGASKSGMADMAGGASGEDSGKRWRVGTGP